MRDDQSPFFKETMSELLQGDITEDTAAVALLNYLSKLEEVAKLEPCGIHYVEYEAGKTDEVAHVVARTAGASRKYFYRRLDGGSWSPWEHIKLDIEDNPVIPVMWNNRLFLFWLRILQEVPSDAKQILSHVSGNKRIGDYSTNDLTSNPPKLTVQAVLCWSEYYNGKWQPAKTSDVNHPTELGEFPLTGSDAFDRSVLEFRVFKYPDSGPLCVFVRGGNRTPSFLLYNTHSLPKPQQIHGGAFSSSSPDYQAYWDNPLRVQNTQSEKLVISYYRTRPFSTPPEIVREVLENAMDDRVIQPVHVLESPWVAPFFYEDGRHVFYVTTTWLPISIDVWEEYAVTPSTPVGEATEIFLPVYHEREEIMEEAEMAARVLAKINGPGFSFTEGAKREQVEKVFSGDANITMVWSSNQTVRYGSRNIGWKGSTDITIKVNN